MRSRHLLRQGRSYLLHPYARRISRITVQLRLAAGAAGFLFRGGEVIAAIKSIRAKREILS
jgi:hypothetical protein